MLAERELPPWKELRPDPGWRQTMSPRELWAFREVARTLVHRDLKSRYKQAAFGVAWAVVQPLSGVIVFTLVFNRVAHVASEGVPYPVFVFAGLLLWNYFSTAVTAAAASLVRDPDLVTKVYLPRLLIPGAALVPPLLDFGIAALALMVAMVIYGIQLRLELALVPLALGLVLVVTIGSGVLFAALHARFRDFGHATGLLLQVWFFATPVVYSSTQFSGLERVLLSVNPMTGAIDGFRWAVFGTAPPPAEDALSLASAAVLVGIGLVWFHRLERRLADVI